MLVDYCTYMIYLSNHMSKNINPHFQVKTLRTLNMLKISSAKYINTNRNVQMLILDNKIKTELQSTKKKF